MKNPFRAGSTINAGAVARSLLNIFLIACIAVGGGFVGYNLGTRGYVGSAAPSSILHALGTGNVGENPGKLDFSDFWQAWNVIDQKFYGNTDPAKRLDGAISGMVAGLGDPYTLYLPPSQNQLFQSGLEGSFGGIGAELEVKNGLVTVVAALQDTPADKAGIKANDIIAQVDGTKATDLNFEDLITKIRGTKGTDVHLVIVRAGQDKPLNFTITRDTITVKSVSTSSIGAGGNTAYIKVNQFGADTVSLLSDALTAAKTSNKKALIIDLRNNPGGYLDAAVQAIGMVIPQNSDSTEAKLKARVAVLERSKDGSEQDDSSSTAPILDQIPMVVLVNGGSASASEIFAGAMKDYKRATLVGTQSFGKGSVQTIVPLSNGGSVKVTIAKWFTPLGTGIDGKGITPDVVVELPDGTPVSTTDPQVSKALEILKQQ